MQLCSRPKIPSLHSHRSPKFCFGVLIKISQSPLSPYI